GWGRKRTGLRSQERNEGPGRASCRVVLAAGLMLVPILAVLLVPPPPLAAASHPEGTRPAAAAPEKCSASLFTARILPVLETRCASCHSSARKAGGLDLTTRASLLMGGTSGPAVKSGQPEKSLLYRKIGGHGETAA